VVTNAVMGAVKYHPFVHQCIQTIPAAVREMAGRPLAQMVGPWHLNRQISGFPDVTIHPSHVFYPQSITARDRHQPVDFTGSYTHHTWNTTARKRGSGV
jgi:hypothetical protein